MQNIEQTIVELGGIFQQLATMVKEQEEMVQRSSILLYTVELNLLGDMILVGISESLDL